MATQMDNSSIERWGWASIGVNILLSLLNLIISIASGSLAVAAEMVHNLIDLAASVAVLVGLKISQRRSKAFPYGLYKVENIVAVGVSALIFFTGYEIVREALFALPRATTVNLWMLAGVILSAAIPLAFGYFELRAGKKVNSPSLIADAQEYHAHVFSSGVVFTALLGQFFGLRLDRWAALFVAAFIVKTGWELLRDGMRVLLDASLDASTLSQVREIIQNEPSVVQVKTLIGRNSGRYRFLEAEVGLRVNDLQKAHSISQHLQQTIKDSVPHVERVLIHYEPIIPTHLRYAFPLAAPDGRLSEHFGKAPYMALITLRLIDGAIEKREVIINPHCQDEKAKGIKVAEWLVSLKVDRIFIKESLQGKGPEYVFANAGVKIESIDCDTLNMALDKELTKRNRQFTEEICSMSSAPSPPADWVNRWELTPSRSRPATGTASIASWGVPCP
jgi:cation diffusion facilitator family transporter